MIAGSILQRLSRWSLAKLLFVCFGWLGLCILAPIAYVAAMLFVASMGRDSGSGGIGAVSAGLSAPVLVAFGPIILLIVLWIVAKRTVGLTPRSTPSGPTEGRENR